jgi:hypothetical protein
VANVCEKSFYRNTCVHLQHFRKLYFVEKNIRCNYCKKNSIVDSAVKKKNIKRSRNFSNYRFRVGKNEIMKLVFFSDEA